MKKKPDFVKKMEALKDKGVAAIQQAADRTTEKVTEVAVDIDKQWGTSEIAGELAKEIEARAAKLNKDYGIRDKLKAGKGRVSEGAHDIAASDSWKSLESAAEKAKAVLKAQVLDPASVILDESGVADRAKRTGEAVLEGYGKARARIKPYYAPETPDELLRRTRSELLYINACILQISEDEAAQFATRLGNAVAGKIAGAATAGALMGLVSAFGSASTGTAIASLYGSAHTTTALWWVGSLFGGGAAAGAAITGGLSLIVGVGVYKLLGSEARKIEDLADEERQIIESFAFLTAAIDDTLAQPELTFDLQAAERLLSNTLKPMHQLLKKNEAAICQKLDLKNAAALKQHALVDFEKNVIEGFQHFIDEGVQVRRARYPEFAIAGALYGLLTESVVSSDRESQLALDALRRVKTEWNGASEGTLAEALSDYAPERLVGVASNAKGIYHELLFADDYNRTHTDTVATLHTLPNHPGSDIQIRDRETGELISEIQLKAGSSVQGVREHFEKYPDIPVSATAEIAAKIDECESSGISNVEITREMNDMLDEVVDNTVIDRISEAGGMAGLAASGMEAIAVLEGNRPLGEAGKRVLASMGIAAGSTALVAMLF